MPTPDNETTLKILESILKTDEVDKKNEKLAHLMSILKKTEMEKRNRAQEEEEKLAI